MNRTGGAPVREGEVVDSAYLAELFSPGEPVVNTKLQQLSALSDADAIVFRERWNAVPLTRRELVLERLAALTEDNVEVDFDAVFRIVLDDESAPLRAKAIEALWECQDRWLLTRLTVMAEQDPAPAVRATAAAGLGKFVLLGAMDELRPALVEQVESTLKRIIDNAGEGVGVRRRAVEALSPSNDPDVNGIIRAAYHDDAPEMKLAAIYSMGQHCDAGWLPALLRELRNTDPAFRYEAARACGEMEDERAVPILIELTQDEDGQVQEAALEALGHIGGDDAKRALRLALAAGDPRVSEVARLALEELTFDEGGRAF